MLREKMREIIFGTETPAGRGFDLILLGLILSSILLVMLETVQTLSQAYGDLFRLLEWLITGIFTLEYLVRIYCSVHPRRYIFSFYGMVDLLAILPSFISLFMPGTQSLLVIRGLRLLRVFRILKLAQFVGEANLLSQALWASRRKIIVFIGGVTSFAVIIGALMYLIEGEANGFTSIPRSIYWTIVTMTTVGYGDIAPQTIVGQTLATIVMVLGYGIIAVPTGIVSVELSQASRQLNAQKRCPHCEALEHVDRARYCWNCGKSMKK
jgi:voltage-gated potassium channel